MSFREETIIDGILDTLRGEKPTYSSPFIVGRVWERLEADRIEIDRLRRREAELMAEVARLEDES